LRDFQAIIAWILGCALEKQGITKTGITNEMQLSFTQIKEYLQYLQQYELVSYDGQKKSIQNDNERKEILEII
jgi:predicted transcriptional regulator